MSATLALLAKSSSNVGAFWAVCVIGLFAFAWIAGIAEIAGKPENEFATGTRTTWLLLVIFTGILGLIAYVLVGKKRDTSPSLGGQRSDRAKSHDVRWDRTRVLWVCFEPGCGLVFQDEGQANLHRKLTGTGSVPVAPAGSPPPAPAGPPPPRSAPAAQTASEFKTCPDCAEEVRFAARKCRFCGHMFQSADVPR
jgi:hypothetical protein